MLPEDSNSFRSETPEQPKPVDTRHVAASINRGFCLGDLVIQHPPTTLLDTPYTKTNRDHKALNRGTLGGLGN